jgi:putative membrane protein (TIGR04086 family)
MLLKKELQGGVSMSGRMFAAMISGLLTVLIIVLLSSVVLSLLLRFTSLTEASLNWPIIGLSFLALFIGGFVSGKKGQERGWILGAGTGVLFSILVFLIQFLGYQLKFDTQQSLFHLGYVAIALFGGILGVNLSSHKA